MQAGMTGPRGKGIKLSTSGVRKSCLPLYDTSVSSILCSFMLLTKIVGKVNMDLYSHLVVKPLRRSGMDHTLLPANYTMPAFTS